MTIERDFDRIAKAWLADGPAELPERVLDAVVDEIHLTRQRRAVRAPWRFPVMTTPSRVGAAAVVGILAVGGLLLITRPGQSAVAGPSPNSGVAATASPTAPASVASVPALDRDVHVAATWLHGAVSGRLDRDTGHDVLDDRHLDVAGRPCPRRDRVVRCSARRSPPSP